jgi:hypothetical protein
MTWNPLRVLGIVVAILGVWGGASAQFTTLFGQAVATDITTACSLLVGTLGAIIGVMSNQGQQLSAVEDMPGVEKVFVNAKANSTLAKRAVDPNNPKIEPLPESAAAVQKTANEESAQ